MKYFISILLLLTACSVQPEFIPEPPTPSEVYYEQVRLITWQSNNTVIYEYGCTAGDAYAVVTLKYKTEWNATFEWKPEICPLR
jgi:hypothetical protein